MVRVRPRRDLAAVDDDLTVTALPRPASPETTSKIRFGLVFRGYKQSEVDWTLEKLAREIDELRAVAGALRSAQSAASRVARTVVAMWAMRSHRR